ncbi:hypothetical protein GEMRC1_013014 [Eukaryota sp. GEM-RC1]
MSTNCLNILNIFHQESQFIGLVPVIHLIKAPNVVFKLSTLPGHSIELIVERKGESVNSGRFLFSYPDDFPLRPCKVTFACDLNSTRAEIRKWSLLLNSAVKIHGSISDLKEEVSGLNSEELGYLNNSRFAVISAIIVLSKCVENLDSADMCSICYSVCFYENGSLPNRSCLNCKNKMHTKCLEKWFEASDSRRCPLCSFTFSEN